MKFLMGNELIALSAYQNGVEAAYAYPGTPSSEILEYFSKIADDRYFQWAINEKVALELAASEAISGKFAIACMKMVGLNVAADPLFSVAYTGIKGALVVVSADDPGPYSSQTEQDSRMYAFSSKIPVFDPANPVDAYNLMKEALQLSHEYEIPVMLRPVMRVCHSRQTFYNMDENANIKQRNVGFERDIPRWAATPKFRRRLHGKLNEKLVKIADEYYSDFFVDKKNSLAVVTSGYVSSIVEDLIEDVRFPIDFYKLSMPFPISAKVLKEILVSYEKVLVIEETQPLIEIQFANREKVYGRLNGFITQMGELSYGYIKEKLSEFCNLTLDCKNLQIKGDAVKPRLCAGCGHRPAFYLMRKLGGKDAIYPGDIGCYTLGVNLDAVDTCICMGASVSFAEGLSRSNPDKVVLASIGDSTFFHTGIPALINAVMNDSSFVLCILDNETTAMTGFQPVAHQHDKISIENIVKGCGIEFCITVDPYEIDKSEETLREAIEYVRGKRGIAVVIFKHPCVTKLKFKGDVEIEITDECRNCRICYEKFECPALFEDTSKNRAEVNKLLCVNCGVCISVCPFDAIKEVGR